MRSRRLWLILAAVLAAYAAAGFWMVPRVLSDTLKTQVRERFHRTLELGPVTFNPFTLELSISKLMLPDADGSPLVSFDRLYVNLRFASLILFAPDFKAISLERPRVRLVRRADGRFNLQDLVPPAPAKPAPPGPPPRLYIGELSISNGELAYADLTRATPLALTLEPVSLTVREFSTRSEGNAYSLAAATTHGESFEWHGSFGLAPLASSGRFALKAIKSATISEIAAGALPVELTGGELSLNGSYQALERGADLNVTAKVDQLLLAGLGLRVPGDDADSLSVPKLTIEGVTLDTARHSVEVTRVSVEQPTLRAIRAHDGSLPWSKLAAPSRPAAPAGAAPPAAAAPGWSLAVPRILVDGGTVAFEDRVPRRPATLALSPLKLELNGYSNANRAPLTIDFSTGVNGNGRFAAKGSLSLAPLAATFAIDASALGLPVLQPYIDSVAALRLTSGTAGASGTLTLAANGAIGFKGDARVDAFSTQDSLLGEDFVKWQSLKLAGIRAGSAPLAVAIRELSADQPYARVIIGKDGVTNISAMLKPPETDAAARAPRPPPVAAAASKALPLSIGVVKVADGTMNFTDLSVRPNFSTNILELGGTITGLSGNSDARAKVRLAGKVDRYAPVSITGEVNYFAAVSYSDVKMSFQNVELTGFSPYSGKFAGYRIDKGKLSADLHYQIVNRKLEAQHSFNVSQLQLGERVESPDATSLPVRLAIALLKDRDGVIRLDLPVNGSLDDPQFKIGPIIWKLFVHLIEKAVTAPFALLGSLFGAGEEISTIEFAAGSSELDAAAKGRVATLAKALDARPALNVDVPLTVAAVTDKQALIARRWHEAQLELAAKQLGSRAGTAEALLADPSAYRKLLEAGYLAAFTQRAEIPPPTPPSKDPAAVNAAAIAWLEDALKSRIVVDPAALEALAATRAAAVQAALLDGTGIDPSRVFIVNPGTRGDAPAGAAEAPGPVKLQLTLH